MVDKNVGLIIQETQVKLAELLNKSGLPASILALIMKDAWNQTVLLAQNEIAQPLKRRDTVDLGEGIEDRNSADYDYDNNYTPEHAKK